MMSFYSLLAGPEKVFFLSALAGGFAFLMLTILMFVTGGVDGDAGGFDGDAHSGDTDSSFKGLSLNGVAAFFMMFGLVGLASVREFGASTAVGALYGAVAGAAAMFTLKKLFDLFVGMQASGTLDVSNAVGVIGVVYLTLPERGTGQVELNVQGRRKVMSAASESGEVIPTEERVRVVSVEGNTLRVVRAD
jgi:hypothetical protein